MATVDDFRRPDAGRYRQNISEQSAGAAVGRPMKNMLGAQMRAARALPAADLVRESGVSLATIHGVESVDGKTAMTLANASAIRRALENAGVELIEENGGGLGARLKQRLELIDDNGGCPVSAFESLQKISLENK